MQPAQIVELRGCLYYAFVPKEKVVNDCDSKRAVEIQGIEQDNVLTYARPEEEIKDEQALEATNVEEFVSVNKEAAVTNVYACDDCNIFFPTLAMLEIHTKCTHPNGFKCEVCSKIYCCFADFKLHILQEHKTPDTKNLVKSNAYICTICNYKTTKLSIFNSHISRKHNANNQKIVKDKPQQPILEYSCDICDFKCLKKWRIRQHMMRKHTTELNHQCNYCAKKFKVKSDMRLHERFKHKEAPIVCNVCGKTCSNSSTLYAHQKASHFKPKYECAICHRRMVTQKNLDQHVLSQHERHETFVCEDCGKSFTENHRLKQHMKIHTGDKPHDCHVCGKAFARRNAYRQHLLIHTGKRPYICDICGKSFTQKTGLIGHRKWHPGILPPLPVVHIDHILDDFMKK